MFIDQNSATTISTEYGTGYNRDEMREDSSDKQTK